VIVVDASLVVHSLIDRGITGNAARDAMIDDVAAPSIIDLEVAAALRGLERGNLIDSHRGERAVTDMLRLGVERRSPRLVLPRVWQLRHNANPYDASYVALAELMDLPLVTADAKFLGIPGVRCRIDLISAD
jgi:predicted nucleic acid-binding protein